MNRLSIVAALVTAAVLASCGADDLTGGLPPGEARLAILNALPSGAVATLFLDGDAIPLPERGFRVSRTVPEGTHRLEARTPSGIIAASANFAVGDGSRRTAILGGGADPNAAAILITADTASIPTGGGSKVRLVHTVQGTSQLEAWLSRIDTPFSSSSRLVSPFSYGVGLSPESPGYVVRTAGQYRVTVTSLDDGSTLAESIVALDAHQVWSVILIRDANGELELTAIRER